MSRAGFASSIAPLRQVQLKRWFRDSEGACQMTKFVVVLVRIKWVVRENRPSGIISTLDVLAVLFNDN